MTKTKKLLSLLLALCMLMSVAPAIGITASAEVAGDSCPECGSPLEWADYGGEHMLQCSNGNCWYWCDGTNHSNGEGGDLGCTLGDCASGGTGDNPGGGTGGASMVYCESCQQNTAQWQQHPDYSDAHCLICTNPNCLTYNQVKTESIHTAEICANFGCNYSSGGGTGGGDAQQEAENLYNALIKPNYTPEDMTYTLQADVVFDQTIPITDQKILYLNGHTITFNDYNRIVLYGGENGEYTPSLTVYGGSNEYDASCFDSDGSIISYDEYSFTTSSICVMAGTLTVHGGKIGGIDIGNNTFFKAVNIDGGFIHGYDGCFDAENTTLNITGGYYTARGMLFDAENNPLYADGYGIERMSDYDVAYYQVYTYQVVKAVSLKSVSSLGEQGGVKFYQETVGTDEKVTRSEVTSVVGGVFNPYVEAIDVPGYTAALSVTGNAALSYNYLYIDELYNSGSGIYPDSVTITATYTAKTTYAVTADTCAGGTVTADKSSTYEGDTVTVTATPDSGYAVDTISAYKTGDTATTVTVTDGTFTMPAYAVTVSATFKKIPEASKEVETQNNITISEATETVIQNYVDAQKDSISYDTKYKFAVKEKTPDDNVKKTAIENKAGNKRTITFFDATFTKTETINSVAQTPVEIEDTDDSVLSFTIPYDMTGKCNLGVFRYHGGEATELTRVYTTANPQDGTYYVEGSGANTKVTVFASKFSAYALGATALPEVLTSAGYSASLTLNKNIDINFKMSNLGTDGKGTGFDKSKLTITVDGDTWINYTVKDGVLSGVLKVVEPNDIGTAWHIVVTYDNVQVKNFTYSVKSYCEAVFNANTDGKYDTLADLCEALLNYGKYAEDYANQNTASTLNAGYEIDFSKYNLGDIAESNVTGTASFANLSLGSTITLKYYVNTDKELTNTDSETQNFFVLNGNLQIDPDRVIVKKETEDERYNYVVSIDLYASQLSTSYTLKLKGVSTDDFCITYGVYNYCNDIQSMTGSVTLKYLCKAIHNYSVAVDAYIASTAQ